MKKILATAVCAAALASGAHAATATFDFVALAAGNEGGIEGMSFTNNGMTVTVTSSANAYLDDLNAANRPAGLGVCQTLNGGGQCTPSGDDNLGAGESVTLRFSHFISDASEIGLSFYDKSHNDLTGSAGMFSLASNVDPGLDFTFGDATDGNFTALSGEFSYTFGYVDTAYYLGSISVEFDQNNQAPPIPLPAGLPLLAGALGLLALNRRRKAA